MRCSPSPPVACLCSNASFTANESNMAKPVVDRNVLGDATEAGILKCYESIMGDSEVVRKQCPKKIGIPFNSRNKYQVGPHYHDHHRHHHHPAGLCPRDRWASSAGDEGRPRDRVLQVIHLLLVPLNFPRLPSSTPGARRSCSMVRRCRYLRR